MDANGRKFKEWCFSLLGSFAFLQHNFLPVESWVPEIQDKSRLEAGDLYVDPGYRPGKCVVLGMKIPGTRMQHIRPAHRSFHGDRAPTR